MIKTLAILAAVATTATLILPNSAQAIVYNVNGTLGGGSPRTLSGSFDFNGTTYTSWNLTVSGFTGGNAVLNQTFSSSAGSLFTSSATGSGTLAGNGASPPSSNILSVALPGSNFTGADNTSGAYLVLSFATPLSTSAPSNLTQGNTTTLLGSYVRSVAIDGGGNLDAFVSRIDNGAVATPVPLETDALPVLGAVAFMGAGFWFKRRQAQAKANFSFLVSPQDAEPVLEKSV
jgi:hypothetical protein